MSAFPTLARAVAVDGDHLAYLSCDAANAASHGWTGIHFRSASDARLHLGRDVGNAVIAWAESDGAD